MIVRKTMFHVLLVVVIFGAISVVMYAALSRAGQVPEVETESYYATVQGTIAGYGAQESVIYVTGVPREFEKLLILEAHYNLLTDGTYFGETARFSMRESPDGWVLVGILTATRAAGYVGRDADR